MACQPMAGPPAGPAAHRVPLPSPFSFHLTAGHQTFFRGQTGADYYEDGVYRRVLDQGERLVLATVRETPAGDDLEVTLSPDPLDPATVTRALHQVAWLFALDADFSEFLTLATTDPLVAALNNHFSGLRPARTPTVFEALVQAIIGQQISGAVARRIRDLVVEALGAPFAQADRVYRAYPRPEAFAAASIADLRALKLSQRKAEYLREIAGRVAGGELDLEGLRFLPNAEVVKRLSARRGIGRWTAEWVMLRALGRIDAFPANDLALCRILAQFYTAGRPITDREAAALATRWGASQGLVTTYLFAAIRQKVGLGAPPAAYSLDNSASCRAKRLGTGRVGS